MSASTGCPPRPCTLGSVPSDSPRVGVDAPEDDALPELANEAPILYTKHDVVSLIAHILTRNKINVPAVAHGPEIAGSAPGDGPRRARVGAQRAGVRAPGGLVDRGSSVRFPLIPPRVLRVVLSAAEVHVGEAPAADHLGMRVGRREAEEPAEEPAAGSGARYDAGEQRRADLRGEALPPVALAPRLSGHFTFILSFPLAREKCGPDGRLLRSAEAKAGEGRVCKAAGGRIRSMYRARGVCDGPCANRARNEVVARTTAADFFADVSSSQHDWREREPRSSHRSPATRALHRSRERSFRDDMIGKSSPFNLDGKCAVVTGGTKGLGCVPARCPLR